MICKKCGTDNTDGSKFCCGCGEKLALLCPCCHSEVAPGAMFCSMCGTGMGGSPAPVQAQRGGILNDAVVAGDVSLSSTSYVTSFSGKQSIYCHACGKKLNEDRDEIYKCSQCGEFFCSAHFNELKHMCNGCSRGSSLHTEDGSGIYGRLKKTLRSATDFIFSGAFDKARGMLERIQREFEEEGETIDAADFYWSMLLAEHNAVDNDALVSIFSKGDKELSREVNYRMALRKATAGEAAAYESVLAKVTEAKAEAAERAKEKRRAEEEARAEAVWNEPGVTFSEDKKTLIRYSVDKKAASYRIPYGVTAIADHAFRECSSIKEVIIPDTVKSIGYAAFFKCTQLKEITVPESVTEIKEWAFGECISLTGITLNARVTEIANDTFRRCQNLFSINIPSGVTSIGENAFFECSKLECITIPSRITVIGQWAFGRCPRLKGIILPSSVTCIGDNAFRECTDITTLTVHGAASIGNAAFFECTSLKSVSITEVTSIDEWAFSKCSALKKIQIPGSVSAVSGNAFRDCTCLSSVNMLSGVKSIGYAAFYNCSELSNVSIPSSVTVIGEWGFGGCPKLSSIQLPSNIRLEDNAFYGSPVNL